jgi:hypothetical protein
VTIICTVRTRLLGDGIDNPSFQELVTFSTPRLYVAETTHLTSFSEAFLAVIVDNNATSSGSTKS